MEEGTSDNVPGVKVASPDRGVAVIGISSVSRSSSSARSVIARFEEPNISCRLRVMYAVRTIMIMKPMTST